MRVYISGPMTGFPDYNRQAFSDAFHKLLLAGHVPVSPAKYEDGKTYQEYMRDDLKDLLCCDGIYMLDGWKDSNGARIEYFVASTCGIQEVTL